MTDLFEMLNTITRRRKGEAGSPFASLKATEKWLRNLPADSDYDAHHALVEALRHRLSEIEKRREPGNPNHARVGQLLEAARDAVRDFEAWFDATRQLRAAHPEARVLIVTKHNDEALRAAAFVHGATGFVAKENLLELRALLSAAA